MASIPNQRSVPDVLQEIVANVQSIMRSEVRLAITEAKEEVGTAARPCAVFGLGLVAALYGAAFLLVAAFLWLSIIMYSWAAALLIGSVLAITGSLIINSVFREQNELAPRSPRSAASIREESL